ADRSYRALCRVQKCFRARTATGTEVVVSQSDNPRTGATLRVVDTPEGPAIEASTGDEARQRGDGAPDRACPKDDEGGCPLGD
ncbi:hypothetical protein RZS08_34230, partial [Arthrospira platensis SPKY1]|nr:hypothetical protein [Arthrospira platensis SPKY1]